MLPGADRFSDSVGLAVDPDILDHDHRVIARRDDVPGVNPRCVRECHRVLLARPDSIGAPDRDPVHCRDVDRRDREPGEYGRCGDPADRLGGHRDPHNPGNRLEGIFHECQRFCKRYDREVSLHHKITSTSSPTSSPSLDAGIRTSPSLWTRVLRSPDFPKIGVARPPSMLTLT